MEQKRAASSSPNTRKLPPAPIPPIPPPPKISHSPPTVGSPKTTNSPPAIGSPKIINSPPNSPKSLSKTTPEQTFSTQKNPISSLSRLHHERSKLTRSSDSLLNPLTATHHSFPTVNIPSNETMVMRYQTIQRYKSNFEILKPATVIAEDWRNLDKTQKDRLAIGGPKALVLVSKSSTPNKHIQVIQT